MRRFDKIKLIHKANLLTEERYLKSKGLLTEIEVYPYKINDDVNKDDFTAKFNANGLSYNVHVWHDESKHAMGEYEVSFDVDTQKSPGERQGKDIRHLNNVLYTVLEIVEVICKKNNISNIKIEGARDEKDAGGLFDDTSRARIYTRLLKNKYPDDAITSAGRYIKIDMAKIFPDVIKQQSGKVDSLVNLLVKISDGDPNEAGIRRGLNGKNDDDFSLWTDFVDNSKLGTIEFEIDVFTSSNEFDVKWNVHDSGEEDSQSFNSFDELFSYIENKFINVEGDVSSGDSDNDDSKYPGNESSVFKRSFGYVLRSLGEEAMGSNFDADFEFIRGENGSGFLRGTTEFINPLGVGDVVVRLLVEYDGKGLQTIGLIFEDKPNQVMYTKTANSFNELVDVIEGYAKMLN